MKTEKNYDFRKKLLTVHEKDVRDYTKKAPEDCLMLENGIIIEIGSTENIVIRTAAEDFIDYLAVSMGIRANLSTTGEHSGSGVIRLALAADCQVDLAEACGYKGFLIEVAEGIQIYGYDDRGVAAALYYLEDLMNMDHAPYVKMGSIRKKPMFAPQMIHSGYGMEEWPDEYLMRVAHEGRDALLVFATDVNQTRVGFLDFNDLIRRAAKYGLDVYAYSFFRSGVHPDEERAESYYDNTYGRLFRECPGLKGVTLVGEVVEIPSKDPHASSHSYEDSRPEIVPDGKCWAGWYPCEDLPKWVELIKRIIRKEKADADIVLWTYNWGFQPEEARIRLIENLPTDITLQATFEMFETWKVGNSAIVGSDYSLAFAGPGQYFASEAAAAKKRGIRLYAMTQSAGVTWDFGVIPYEPMPYQWMKRYEQMRLAKENWGLCGGMDTHHHGMYPSIITKFSKHAFLEPAEPMEDILDRILVGEYGAENLEKVKKGFSLWSEAIRYYTPTEGDFCCASRVGPSYPFCLYYKMRLQGQKGAVFGANVVGTEYNNGMSYSFKVMAEPEEPFLNLRILEERKSLEHMLELMNQGIAVFDSIPEKNEKLSSVLNLGRFIACCVTTNIHAKTWHILKTKFNAEYTKEGLLALLPQMEEVLRSERVNAESAIPLVEADSRLGWEPSMLYLTDRAHLEWKLDQLDYVLEKELVKIKKCIEFDVEKARINQ